MTKQVAKVETKPTFTELTNLGIDELIAEAKFTVKLNKAIGTARTKFTETLQFSAKVVAALKVRLANQLNAKPPTIATDMTFKKYFEQIAGGVCPARVETLSAFFNLMVETELITEEVFDEAAVDWLERANAIVKNACKKFGDAWKGSDDVLDVINALSKPGDARAKLKAIRERQIAAEVAAGTRAADDETETKAEAAPLTLGVAMEFIMALFSDAENASAGRQEELCDALFSINEAWGANGLKPERRDELDSIVAKARENGVAIGVEVIRADEPAAVAA
jgi:hypothetical protein